MTTQSEEETLQFQHTDDLNGVVAKLHPGDTVILGDRSLAMDVFDVGSECIGSDPHPTKTVYLELRGRVYRLRGACDYPGGKDTTPPMLELRKEGTWDSVQGCITEIEITNGQQILSDTRVEDWFGEAGISIR